MKNNVLFYTRWPERSKGKKKYRNSTPVSKKKIKNNNSNKVGKTSNAISIRFKNSIFFILYTFSANE